MPATKTWLRICCLLLGLVSLSSVSVLAAPPAAPKSNTTTAIQSVAQSYGTATPLQQALIVQVDPKHPSNVIAADYSNAKKMLGVVVSANAAPVTLSDGAAGQEAYVVNSGRYQVLVSTQNGSIGNGDYVSISAIDGIGMKADTTEGAVLGRAVGSFTGKSGVISSTTLKTSAGKPLKVNIGTVTVDIGVTKNPQLASSSTNVPQFIQKVAISIVGKPISAPQFYASIAILLAGVGVVASLLYGGIQTGMTAIGRNPLARQSIMRNLIQVIVTGLLIFIGCLIAVYLILKL